METGNFFQPMIQPSPEANRRQMMAQYLIQQGQGREAKHPLDVIANMLNVYTGAKMQKGAEDDTTQRSDAARNTMAKALADYRGDTTAEGPRPTMAAPQGMMGGYDPNQQVEAAGPGAPITTTGTGQNRQALLNTLMGNPDTASMASMMEMQQAFAPKAPKTYKEVTVGDPNDPNRRQIKLFNPQDPADQMDLGSPMSGNSGGGGNPYYDDIQGDEGIVIMDKRTGNLTPAIDPVTKKRMVGAQYSGTVAQNVSSAKKTGAGQADRLQSWINDGQAAADATAVTRRAIDLLDSVPTGGYDAAALKAKQLFGIESANEAELSSGLGKAVLSQLRSTFGAQFTENEGQRLATIESNFGKSTAGNKRLLEQALTIYQRAADRGIQAAELNGDTVSAKNIRDALGFTLNAGDAATSSTPDTGKNVKKAPDGVDQDVWDVMTPDERAAWN